MSTTADVVGAETKAAETNICCANCGIAGVDNIKLLDECTDCDLVKYCSDKCRDDHREEHEEECKNRFKELHDRKLFAQPKDNYLGECTLCFLPLPLDLKKSAFYSCCSSLICKGCVYANISRNKHSNAWRCPFCREPSVCSDEE